MQEIVQQFSETIRRAAENKTPLRIRGGGSKDFYGARLEGDILDTTPYTGIVGYEPTELVITARAGTKLSELEADLRGHGQMLPFEPPRLGPNATLGGCVAAGLSGPRRAYAGAVRDFVLGVRLLDGNGNDLKFGGQVMKNVAGYDVSRLMTGSLGTLGMLLEVSLKVLPLPPAELTVRLQMTEAGAIEKMNQWGGKPLPISATCFHDGVLTVRLSGADPAVRAAQVKLGGEVVPDAEAFWESVREQTHVFFQNATTLWRLSVKSTTPQLKLQGSPLIEWGGSLRWLAGDQDPPSVRRAAENAGGHATLFRDGDKSVGVFHPLAPGLMKLHRRLKQTFDPAGILNPGRMYEEF